MASITEAPYEPLGSNLSQRAMRAHYLLLIEELAPAVLTALAGEPFEAFKRAHLALAVQGKTPTAGELLDGGVGEVLAAWARAFRMDADWVRAAALHTMRAWLTPQGLERIGKQWCDFYFAFAAPPIPPSLQTFAFVAANNWHPADAAFDRAHTEREVRAAFEAALTSYLSELENYAHDLKAIPSIAGLTESTGIHADKAHLRWCVLNRCRRRTPQEIRRQHAPTTSAKAIAEGIRTAEKWLGLGSLRKRGGARAGARRRAKFKSEK